MREDLDLQVRTNKVLCENESKALQTIERNKERELEYTQIVANKNELITQVRKFLKKFPGASGAQCEEVREGNAHGLMEPRGREMK